MNQWQAVLGAEEAFPAVSGVGRVKGGRLGVVAEAGDREDLLPVFPAELGGFSDRYRRRADLGVPELTRRCRCAEYGLNQTMAQLPRGQTSWKLCCFTGVPRDRSAVTQHLGICSNCAAMLSKYRELSMHVAGKLRGSLGHGSVWEASGVDLPSEQFDVARSRVSNQVNAHRGDNMITAFSRREACEQIYPQNWDVYLRTFTNAIFGETERYTRSQQIDIALTGTAQAAARWVADPCAQPQRRTTAKQMQALHDASRSKCCDGLRASMVLTFERTCHGHLLHNAKTIKLPAELGALGATIQLRGLLAGAADAFEENFPRATTLRVIQDLLMESRQ